MGVSSRQKIEVSAGHPYPVFLGANLEDLGDYMLSRFGNIEQALIITQPVVAKHYADRVRQGFKGCRVDLVTVSAGEGEKSLARLSALVGEAVRLGADRLTLVVALGGGVIGDLAGFFAGVFMRGIRFVQVPTTLLAMVDSSIGGKVAVNHPAGKNLLGAFYPPLAVWTDFSTLASLPWQEVQNGLAETVKHAVLGDPDLFAFLEEHLSKILERDPLILRELTARSLAVKVRLVSQDEREQGVRALLNLGHSFGHALETATEYEGISHGRGVSVGLVAASRLAEERGLIAGADVQRIMNLLSGLGLPISVRGLEAGRLVQLMAADKKNRFGRKVLILPRGIGQAVQVEDCSDEDLRRAWAGVIDSNFPIS
ncbi:3-dehydroquinate synthase [Acididesulfobacillus acetoxydans]|uniref:3-dehydroquinate synthase n=1 Tax=Acididesulfobacillus acetoxydans TaxID=1561005 RepID=A0A8S0W3E5_9FIRM|nr:3-dehydroquinate synthase [Acididesulfobacillus acetoxydans]CAA7601588.1 3-dehydroquinate synthase [Acididesulfobacillus acetoxydans]CEJ07075.1 3-dehydroquinate synthase [Acididesulfobacillus acetoxydans]